MLNVTGGTLAAITSIVAMFVFGYSLLTAWTLAAIVIYVVIGGTGILLWARVGREIEERPIHRADRIDGHAFPGRESATAAKWRLTLAVRLRRPTCRTAYCYT